MDTIKKTTLSCAVLCTCIGISSFANTPELHIIQAGDEFPYQNRIEKNGFQGFFSAQNKPLISPISTLNADIVLKRPHRNAKEAYLTLIMDQPIIKEGGKDGRILGPESQKPDTGWIAFTRSSQINDGIVVAVNPILSDRGIKITSNQTVQYLNTTYKADLPSSHPRIVSDMNVVKTYELMDGGGDVLAVFNELNADSPSGEYRAIYSASYHVDGLPTFHTITSERYVYIDEPIEVIEVEPKDANKQLAFFKQLFDTASRLSNRKESFDKEENTLRRASMGLDTVADIIDLTDRDENIVFVRTNRLILAIHDEDEKEILDLLKIKQKGKKIEYMGIPELDINQQIKLSENNPGYTALMMCAMLGDKKTVEYLLGFSQLDIDATSDQGTARDIAESLGHTDIVEILELESMKRKIYRRN